jgi:hypothetical protein
VCVVSGAIHKRLVNSNEEWRVNSLLDAEQNLHQPQKVKKKSKIVLKKFGGVKIKNYLCTIKQ